MKKYYSISDYDTILEAGRIIDLDEDYMQFFFKHYPNINACLVPLVGRQAKLGEYFVITQCTVNKDFVGKLLMCIQEKPLIGTAYRENGELEYNTTVDAEYLVLDGYCPKPMTSKSSKAKTPYEQHKMSEIGIMPRYVWDERRAEALRDAIRRFLNAKQNIPLEWVTELNELTEGNNEI